MGDVANQGGRQAPEDVAAGLLGKLRDELGEDDEREFVPKPVDKPVEAKPEPKAAKVEEPEDDEAPEVEANEQTEAAVEEPEPIPFWQQRITDSDPIGQTNRFWVGRTPTDVARSAQENFRLYSETKGELDKLRAEQASVEVLKELLQAKTQPEQGDPLQAELAKRGINLDTDILTNPNRVIQAAIEIGEQRASSTIDERLSSYEQKKQAEAQAATQKQQFEANVAGALEATFQYLAKNDGVPYEEATKWAEALASKAAYKYGVDSMTDPNVYYQIWKDTIPQSAYKSSGDGQQQEVEAQIPEPPKQAANPPGAKRSTRTTEPQSTKTVPTLKGEQLRVAEQWGDILSAKFGLDRDTYVGSVAEHIHREKRG
jgi:hypothetical protein